MARGFINGSRHFKKGESECVETQGDRVRREYDLE